MQQSLGTQRQNADETDPRLKFGERRERPSTGVTHDSSPRSKRKWLPLSEVRELPNPSP